MAKKHVLASARGDARAGAVAVRVERAAMPADAAGADDPNNANLTYWYWGEDDAPGANELDQEGGRGLREGASEGQDHARHRSPPTR